MDIRVRQKRLTSSGGDFLVHYDAIVEIVDGVSGAEIIEVSGISPHDAHPGDVQAAVDAIQRGAEKALQPHSKGATILIHYLLIHPVDMKPEKFEQITAQEFAALLAGPTATDS